MTTGVHRRGIQRGRTFGALAVGLSLAVSACSNSDSALKKSSQSALLKVAHEIGGGSAIVQQIANAEADAQQTIVHMNNLPALVYTEHATVDTVLALGAKDQTRGLNDISTEASGYSQLSDLYFRVRGELSRIKFPQGSQTDAATVAADLRRLAVDASDISSTLTSNPWTRASNDAASEISSHKSDANIMSHDLDTLASTLTSPKG